MKREAFPKEIDSDVFGTSPRPCSPASAAAWSLSSESEEDTDEQGDQEWIFPGGLENEKSSPAEETRAATGAASDVEGLLTEIDTEAETKDDEMPIADEEGPLTPSPIKGNGFVDEMLSEDATAAQGESQESEDPSNMTQLPGGKRQKTSEETTPLPRPPTQPASGVTQGRSLSSFDTNAGEVTGYNPFRREFDPPYDVGAEQMIADLDFVEDDPEEVTKAKLKLLHLYRWRVHEREQRTEQLKKNCYGLLDVRKIMAMERPWSASEKFADLRPFARYASLDKVERLAKGLCFERTIRRRLQELQEARSLGCRTFAEIRARSKDVKGPRAAERSSAQLIGKWRRCHPEITETGIQLTTLPELNEREKKFCSDVGFSPWQFAVLRDRLLREVEENQGRFSKMLVRSFFRLDTAQAVKLFEFFVAEGKIMNSDRELKKAPPVEEAPPTNTEPTTDPAKLDEHL